MFTKLTDEEKLDCFIYMGKFLSKDEEIAVIQCNMIEKVLDIIIKECDYSFNGVERDGKIFYLNWLDKDLTPEYCDTRIGYIVERTEVYKKLYTAMKEDYESNRNTDTRLRLIKLDYLSNFQYYLCDSWYDFEVDEMLEFFNNYHKMYSHRYFRREGLIYTGIQCEYDSYRPPSNPITWRKKKNINLITPATHYQNGMSKLNKEEKLLKKQVDGIRKGGERTTEDIEIMMEYDFFMTYKNILINGIDELEKNNYKFDVNPFKELDWGFKNSFTGDFASYFEGIGKPEIAKLL